MYGIVPCIIAAKHTKDIDWTFKAHINSRETQEAAEVTEAASRLFTSCAHATSWHHYYWAFERRSRYVKAGREAERWKEVTADMMSDEEKKGVVYVRHRPQYRSDRFNTFIDKLISSSGRSALLWKLPGLEISSLGWQRKRQRTMAVNCSGVNTSNSDDSDEHSEN